MGESALTGQEQAVRAPLLQIQLLMTMMMMMIFTSPADRIFRVKQIPRLGYVRSTACEIWIFCQTKVCTIKGVAARRSNQSDFSCSIISVCQASMEILVRVEAIHQVVSGH